MKKFITIWISCSLAAGRRRAGPAGRSAANTEEETAGKSPRRGARETDGRTTGRPACAETTRREDG